MDQQTLIEKMLLKQSSFQKSLSELGLRNSLPIGMEVEEICTRILTKIDVNSDEYTQIRFIRADVRRYIALSGELEWFKSSIEDYKQIIFKPSKWFLKSLQCLTQIYFFTQNNKEMIPLWEDVRNNVPHNPYVYIGLAYAHNMNEDFRLEIAALSSFLRLVKDKKTNLPSGQCDLMIANAYRNLYKKQSEPNDEKKCTELCQDHFGKSLQCIDTKNDDFCLDTGILFFFLKKHQQALSAFNYLIGTKQLSTALYYRGNILEVYGYDHYSYNDYQCSLKRNIQLGDMQGNAAWNCARLLLRQNKIKNAANYYYLAQALYTTNRNKLDCGIQLIKLQNKNEKKESEIKESFPKKEHDERVSPQSTNKDLADMIEEKWKYAKFIRSTLKDNNALRLSFFDFCSDKIMTLCEVCQYLISVDPLGRPLYYVYYSDALLMKKEKDEKAYTFLRKAITMFPKYSDWTSPILDHTLPGVILQLIQTQQLSEANEPEPDAKKRNLNELLRLINEYKQGTRLTCYPALNDLVYEEILEFYAIELSETSGKSHQLLEIWTELISLSPFRPYYYRQRSLVYLDLSFTQKYEIDQTIYKQLQKGFEQPSTNGEISIMLLSSVEETAKWVGGLGTAYLQYSDLFRYYSIDGMTLQDALNSQDPEKWFKEKIGIINSLHYRIIKARLIDAQFLCSSVKSDK